MGGLEKGPSKGPSNIDPPAARERFFNAKDGIPRGKKHEV
jgi:hypothetical protein